MLRRLLLFAAFVTLAGCSAGGATYDEAYGRPDATRWTYFELPAERVVAGVEAFYDGTEIVLERTREEEGGVVLSLASRRGGARVEQILVQRTTVEGFASRAQLFPQRRPLPREMEQFLSGRE